MTRLWEVLPAVLLAISCVNAATSQSSCNNTGEARLLNGTTYHSGRVELCVLGTWSQICDNGWSQRDAAVLCRQLNFSAINAQAYGKSLYGNSTHPIAFTDFQCLGNETNLINCTKLTAENCKFDSTAGVDCQEGNSTICEQAGFTSCCTLGGNMCKIDNSTAMSSKECYCDNNCHKYEDCCDGIDTTCPETEAPRVCSDNEVMLVGGRTHTEGRLELCVNGHWSTVCNQQWSASNAAVVCRQLQLDPTGAVTTFYGQGNVSILESNFHCTGSEGYLAECNPSNTSVECGHQQDIGINCTTCLHGSVLVHGGGEPQSGQVELCWMGKWVNICEDDWSKEDTNVACRQIGYSGFDNTILAGSSFGTPRYNSEPIELHCNGSEVNITDCPATAQTVNTTCAEIAGIQCHDVGTCEQAGLTNCCVERCETSSGCYCSSACLTFGDCCPDFGRVCKRQECVDGNVRLSYGHDKAEGIVQLCFNGQIGLVCGTSWSSKEAQVLCTSLGLPYTGAWPTSSIFFGANTSLDIPVVTGDFNCTGDEDSLLGCVFSSMPSCKKTDAVGVVCERACSDGDIRLAHGNSSYEGRVEVCVEGVWGTVCDEQWTTRDAEVICNQLNLAKYDAQAVGSAYYGQGLSNRPIYYTDSQCTGVEANITECLTDHNTSLCTHAMDAGVKCAGAVGPCQILSLANNFTGCCNSEFNECEITQPINSCYCDHDCHRYRDCCSDINITCPADRECNTTNMRVVDGPNPLHGRVEVCVDDHWSTICDNHWDEADATVVCKNLTSNLYSVKAYNGSVFAEGSGPIRVGGFQCNSLTPEKNLLDCNHTRSPDCSHMQDAGVQCVFFTDCKTLRQVANFTGCCIPEDQFGSGCAVNKDNGTMCFCDAECRTYNDCCDDIDDICQEDNSSLPSHTFGSTSQLVTGLVPSSTTLQIFNTGSSVPPAESTPSLLITSSSDNAFASTETTEKATLIPSLSDTIDVTEPVSTQYLTTSESVKVSAISIPSSFFPVESTTLHSLTIASMSNPVTLTGTVSAQLSTITSTILSNSSNSSSTVFFMPLTTAQTTVNTTADSTQPTATTSSVLLHTSNQPQSHYSTKVPLTSITAVVGSTFSVIMSPTNNPVHHSNAALANTVEMTLAMHTAQQFSKVVEVFKTITASAINDFCDHNQQMCTSVTDNRKRQSTFVNEEGIVITATASTATGLRIILYAVLINGGVLPRDALGSAIQNAVQDGLYSGIGELNVMTDATDTPLYLILTISASGAILVAIAITVIIIGSCICCRRSSKKNNTKVPVQRTNRAISTTGTQESTYTFAEGPPKCFDYNEEPKFTRIPGLPEYFDYTEQLETTV